MRTARSSCALLISSDRLCRFSSCEKALDTCGRVCVSGLNCSVQLTQTGALRAHLPYARQDTTCPIPSKSCSFSSRQGVLRDCCTQQCMQAGSDSRNLSTSTVYRK